MKAIMVTSILCAGLAMALLSGGGIAAPTDTARQPVVVHLSKFTNDLHAPFMAVKLATAMQEKGAQVTMFVDLEGVRLVDKRQPLDLTWGHASVPLGTLYEKFVAAGGEVWVCPHCAHAAGIHAEDLRTGAQIAEEGAIPVLLLQAEKVLDY